MTFTLQIEKNFSHGDFVYLVTDSDRVRMQAAMANRMASIIDHNFGQDGEDRPKEWHPLGEHYAREFHGGDTTPTLELTGDLRRSIEIEENNVAAAAVFTTNEYAVDHQWGIPGRLHARPFFPMDEAGNVTDYSADEMERVAAEELDRIIAGK